MLTFQADMADAFKMSINIFKLVSIKQCSESSHAINIERCFGGLHLFTHIEKLYTHQLLKPGMDSEELLSSYFVKKISEK